MIPTDLTVAPSAEPHVFTRKAIADAVAAVIPEGRTVAVIAVGNLDGSFHTTFAVNAGKHWQIAANFDVHAKQVSGDVRVLASW